MKLGIDCIDQHLSYFEGKRVGLITNPTGINSKFETTIQVLKNKVQLVALFSPEHGVRGNLQAGERLETYVDQETGCTVYSLYGAIKKPTQEMMEDIDVLCIDIQDAGSRFYTYICTMAYAMEACKEYNKEFVVFDRPNPANAVDFEGNILDLEFRSFIGYYPMVQRHGMTIAELAEMFNEEFIQSCKLKTILMEGYERDMYYEDTNLLWVSPSPNFPTPLTAIIYNATCIFEGTNLSEGRGTTIPFQVVGAPFIQPNELASKLNNCGLEGVHFRPFYFTPTFSKQAKELCGGVEVHVLDRATFKAVKTGWTMLDVIRSMYPNDFQARAPYKEGHKCMLELNTGFAGITQGSISLEEQYKMLERDTKEFGKMRAKHLMYT